MLTVLLLGMLIMPLSIIGFMGYKNLEPQDEVLSAQDCNTQDTAEEKTLEKPKLDWEKEQRLYNESLLETEEQEETTESTNSTTVIDE